MTHDRLRSIAEAYLTAREAIVRLGFAGEVDWQESRDLAHLSESEFLAETAWTILASGFRESIVRKLFPEVSAAFLEFRNADAILRHRRTCEQTALQVLNHPPKIRAISSMCARVAQAGFTSILFSIKSEGLAFLQSFSFVGPVTSYHLAKNIGLHVVKPDRHLLRLAAATRFASPLDLCRAISALTGDSLPVIDIVLWRFATVTKNYCDLFAPPHVIEQNEPPDHAAMSPPDSSSTTHLAAAFPVRRSFALRKLRRSRPSANPVPSRVSASPPL